MLAVYRTLLRLYPAAHRQLFGGEMLKVLAEESSGAAKRSLVARIRLSAREACGLMLGAGREHLRMLVEIQDGLSLATGRFQMRN